MTQIPDPGSSSTPAGEASEGLPSVDGDTAVTRATSPPARSKPFWSRTKVAVSVLVGVISVVTGVISVVPVLTKDPSNFSHLRIDAAMGDSEAREWALPPAAFDGSYPTPAEGSSACGEAQVAWLDAHGQPLNRRIHLKMRNSAAEGPALALVDFRTTAEMPAERGEPQVRVTCVSSAQLPETVYYARLDADTKASTARDVVLKRGEGDQQEQMGVAVNLRPGESQQTLFELFARFPAEGAIEVTVLSGEDERVIEIEGSEFRLPPLLFSGEMYLVTAADGLRCERVDGGSIQPCTVEEMLFEASAAQQ